MSSLSAWFPYEWRPYQKESFNAISNAFVKRGITEQMVVQATGLGKRSQAVQISNVPIFHDKPSLFLAHREELINQAVADFEKCHGFTNVGVIKGSRFEIDKKIIIASPQTLVNRLDRISPDHFGLVQIDECFIAGTKIDNINIEEIKVGDIVSSFNHSKNLIEKRKVINVIKRKSPKYLYHFNEFSCTENHPVFIKDIGYCIAKEIYSAYICHILMCCIYDLLLFKYLFKLWNKFFCKKSAKNLFRKVLSRKNKKTKSKNKSKNDLFLLWNKFRLGILEQRKRNNIKTKKNIHSYDFKRFWLLFRKMQKGILQEIIERKSNKKGLDNTIRTNEEKQSNDKSINKSKDDKINARKNIFVSWWKWSINKTTKINCRKNESSNGICNKNKRSNFIRNLFTLSLQSRFSCSRNKTSNRNRWKNSSIKTLEILRQTENNNFEFIGLDYNKIQKRRSRSKHRKSNQFNYVYNLEIEGNNNYFANGILVHNCHNYMAVSMLKTVRHFNHKLRIGWTATPHRLDGLSLSNLFEEIVYEYNLDQGIKEKYLCELDAIRVKTSLDLSKVHKAMGDFNQHELEQKVDTPERNRLIVQKYLEYAEGRQFIAFAVTIQHANNLAEKFRERGIAVMAVSSESNNRQEADRMLRNKELTGIVNVNIYTEGFDYSELGCIIDASPTTSLTRYLQRIGRGTRLKSEEFVKKFGQNCIILDIIDNTGKHNVVNTWTLDRTKKASEKTFVTSEKRDKLQEAEDKRASERTFVANIDRDTRVNLLRLPKVVISGSPKMLEQATDAQIQFLKNLGIYDAEIEYTKALASEAISNTEAASWQMKKLKEWGYDVSEGVTIGQFQKVKQKIENDAKYKISDKEVKNALNLLNNGTKF